MTEPEVIDRTILDGLLDSVGNDREFLAELLQAYFDDSPNLLAAMYTALAAGDAEAFRRAAHSLKSNSTNFGAMALSRMCKQLEGLGKSGTLDGAEATIAQVEAEYARVKGVLQALGA